MTLFKVNTRETNLAKAPTETRLQLYILCICYTPFVLICYGIGIMEMIYKILSKMNVLVDIPHSLLQLSSLANRPES